MWATIKEGKRRPPRGHMVIAHDGEILPLHEWAMRLNIPYETLRNRLHKVMDDRHASGLIPNKLTADEAAHVLRPRRLSREEHLQNYGFVKPVRKSRPLTDDPTKSPYYDLTDAQFEAIKNYARSIDVHMVFIRPIMMDLYTREEFKRMAFEWANTKEPQTNSPI